jgi:hypothetical protein
MGIGLEPDRTDPESADILINETERLLNTKRGYAMNFIFLALS